jgi:hypothetical protein
MHEVMGKMESCCLTHLDRYVRPMGRIFYPHDDSGSLFFSYPFLFFSFLYSIIGSIIVAHNMSNCVSKVSGKTVKPLWNGR